MENLETFDFLFNNVHAVEPGALNRFIKLHNFHLNRKKLAKLVQPSNIMKIRDYLSNVFISPKSSNVAFIDKNIESMKFS